MRIKEEYIDSNMSSPFTGKQIWLRELNPEEYKYWFKNGYEYIFEKDIIFPEIKISKK